jgi:hypothetical protein
MLEGDGSGRALLKRWIKDASRGLIKSGEIEIA